MESCGDLLLVSRCCSQDLLRKKGTKKLESFELKLNQSSEKVKSWGDYSLSLGERIS